MGRIVVNPDHLRALAAQHRPASLELQQRSQTRAATRGSFGMQVDGDAAFGPAAHRGYNVVAGTTPMTTFRGLKATPSGEADQSGVDRMPHTTIPPFSPPVPTPTRRPWPGRLSQHLQTPRSSVSVLVSPHVGSGGGSATLPTSGPGPHLPPPAVATHQSRAGTDHRAGAVIVGHPAPRSSAYQLGHRGAVARGRAEPGGDSRLNAKATRPPYGRSQPPLPPSAKADAGSCGTSWAARSTRSFHAL